MTEHTGQHKGAAAEQIVDAVLALRPGVHFDSARLIEPKMLFAIETICALANTEGGMLALGVDDFGKAWERHRLYGVEEDPHALPTLQRLLDTHISPPIDELVFETLHVALRDGAIGSIVLVCVPQSAQVHRCEHIEATLQRLASINRKLSAAAIDELKYRRGLLTAESWPVNVPLTAIETAHWQRYCAANHLPRNDTATRLLQLGLGVRVGDAVEINAEQDAVATCAAVLLFADDPDALLKPLHMQAGVRILHCADVYRSREPVLTRPPRRLTGPLAQLLEQASDAVINDQAAGFGVNAKSASNRSARISIPADAVRAALGNALLHRDYRYARDIDVRIFPKRIEIESPGDLPGGIHVSKFFSAQPAPRNPLLKRALTEDEAQSGGAANRNMSDGGIAAIVDALREAGLYPPQVAVKRIASVPTVTVTLLGERRPPEWDKAMRFLDQHGCMITRDLVQLSNLDTPRAHQQLKRWTYMGLLAAEDLTHKKLTVYCKRGAPPPNRLAALTKLIEIQTAHTKKPPAPKAPRRRIKLPEFD